MAPDQVQVRPDGAATSLEVAWRTVTRDIDGHQLLDTTQSYAIYRSTTHADLEELATLAGFQVASVLANPQDATTPTLRWIDTEVQGRYGTMVYVRCGPEGQKPPAAKSKARPKAAAKKPSPKPVQPPIQRQ